ncbi:MAG: hypothetical protein IPL55_18530 [Saprospiraceae bacterium]|nr:hypothetical protein [Saprospiraceae bacterium]
MPHLLTQTVFSIRLSTKFLSDYLAVGSDTNFCRIPMNPHTAQKLATLFGASLITSKISDHIYTKAPLKLAPFPYTPGNANETVRKFIEHNDRIEKQKVGAGGKNGQLIAGIKKKTSFCLFAWQNNPIK